ncbi:heat stress transcription factor B-3 [Argentina anserina]|uniref:heat stress transcription factor B-3 n=1 Tax=Argentina anserina TaxID=57926 RepID=UPI0021769295|nr:heat stress transcription factor B-3 [Potentilla anserina]
MEGVCDQKGLLESLRKSSPPPFLLKTYMLVEDPATDPVISWNEDGSAFVVWQPAEFSRDLLPTLFKHSNFSSFVRQLNTYGFRKVATSRWEFCNEKFRKGEKDHLCEIRRRKAWANKQQPTTSLAQGQEAPDYDHSDEDQERSSSTSSSEYSSLIDENKRLKMENGVLSCELTSMKNKCKELLDLVAKYGRDSERGQEEEDQRPKLFGVRLEVEGERERKRKRELISESASILLSQACK